MMQCVLPGGAAYMPRCNWREGLQQFACTENEFPLVPWRKGFAAAHFGETMEHSKIMLGFIGIEKCDGINSGP